MKFNLAGDIRVGNKLVSRVELNGTVVWSRFVPEQPEFEVFDGELTGARQVTIYWEIETNVPLNRISYRVNNGTWTNITPVTEIGSVSIGNLFDIQVHKFEMRARNEVGETFSQTISFSIMDNVIRYEETFSDSRHVTGEPWKDPSNGNYIMSGGAGSRPSAGMIMDTGGSQGKYVQVKYYAWTAGGTNPGSQRIEYPFQHFYIQGTRGKAYELSMDWFFEAIWNFNTIGQDGAEIKRRLVEIDGYSESAADAMVSNWNPNPTYAQTGFPYQTGKMHGIISDYSGHPPAGGNPIVPGEWSVRCIWVKNEVSHPRMSGGQYVDGANPNVTPTLALYIYDQDRDTYGTIRYSENQYPQNPFTIEQSRWYNIKLLVQIDDRHTKNAICHLRVFQKSNNQLVHEVFVDDIALRGDVEDDLLKSYARRLMLSTFFGGGDMRYGPQMDQAWSDNGVYARNDNFKLEEVLYRPPLNVTNVSGSNVTVTHEYGAYMVEHLEYNRVTSSYSSYNWDRLTPSQVSRNGEEMTMTIPNFGSANEVWVRAIINGRPSARIKV